MKFELFKHLLFSCLLAVSVAHGQIVLEAENGVLEGIVVSKSVAGYSGTGYVTGFDTNTDKVSWSFNATNGLYTLNIRYRAPFGQKGFEATLNGKIVSGMFTQTTAFATYDAGLVELKSGVNTLSIGGGWSWYEIDRVNFNLAIVPPPPLPVPAVPCDPQASLAAWVLLQNLAADYGKITWSGQMEPAEATNTFNISGRRPVIVSADFMDYSPSRMAYGANPGGLSERIISLDNAGYAVSMCWHWNAPTNLINTSGKEWWRGFYTEATTFDIAAALANTNSMEYALLLRDLDVIATQLKKFQMAGVPVLWRPLHESEGGWFWWGAKGSGPFKQLWRLMYQRYTQQHNLHNLLWVLTSEDPDWYPGDDVVDIIGVDAYPSDKSDPLSSRWETLKARFNGRKLIALTEFGGVPDIPKMHAFGVWFAYFLPWTGIYGPTSMPSDTVMRVYQSTNVLTLDEVSALPGRILRSAWVNNQFQVTAKGTRGANHRLLVTTNLPTGNWTPVATNKFSGGVGVLTDTTPNSKGSTRRFYRVVKP